MSKECFQEMMGTCTGCNIYEIAQAKAKLAPENASEIQLRIGRELCPEKVQMQPIRPREYSIWPK